MPDGTGGFTQDYTGPALLRILDIVKYVTCTGLSPYIASFSNDFHFI